MSAPRAVLILDDSQFILDVARIAFEAQGFRVEAALDLTEFESHWERARPDVLVLDIQMPEAFGDDLAMMLRGRGVDAPIVIFSSLEEPELGRRARAAEADDWVCKRDGVQALVSRVRALLERP